MEVEEVIVSYRLAKLLQAKGFEGEYSRSYDYGAIPAPTLQVAKKWIREIHNIDINIDACVGMLGIKRYVPIIYTYKTEYFDERPILRQIRKGLYFKNDKGFISALQDFETYEEACEEAIFFILDELI